MTKALCIFSIRTLLVVWIALGLLGLSTIGVVKLIEQPSVLVKPLQHQDYSETRFAHSYKKRTFLGKENREKQTKERKKGQSDWTVILEDTSGLYHEKLRHLQLNDIVSLLVPLTVALSIEISVGRHSDFSARPTPMAPQPQPQAPAPTPTGTVLWSGTPSPFASNTEEISAVLAPSVPAPAPAPTPTGIAPWSPSVSHFPQPKQQLQPQGIVYAPLATSRRAESEFPTLSGSLDFEDIGNDTDEYNEEFIGMDEYNEDFNEMNEYDELLPADGVNDDDSNDNEYNSESVLDSDDSDVDVNNDANDWNDTTPTNDNEFNSESVLDSDDSDVHVNNDANDWNDTTPTISPVLALLNFTMIISQILLSVSLLLVNGYNA